MDTLETLAPFIAGPAGAMVLLALVLVGFWLLLKTLLERALTHLSAIQAELAEIKVTLNLRMDRVEDDLSKLRKTCPLLVRQGGVNASRGL